MKKVRQTESFLSLPIKKLFSNTFGLSEFEHTGTQHRPSTATKFEAENEQILEAITVWNRQIILKLTPFELENIEESHGSKLWYIEYIKTLHPILTGFWQYIWFMESNESLSISCEWREYESEFKTIISGINWRSDACDCYISLLVVTALSERILGNIFLIDGKNVPFLLRDLLDTCELKKLLGSPLVDFLKVLLGSVHGLNLRNIAWHGFLTPSDVRPEHVAAIVNALHLCHSQLTLSSKNLVARAHLCLHEVYNRLENNWELVTTNYDEAFEIINSSSLILPVMQPYWIKALNLVLNRRKEAVVLLLPLLENSLRILFASTNNCPGSRILTANDSTFYITLDEILAPFVDSLAINESIDPDLIGFVEPPLLENEMCLQGELMKVPELKVSIKCDKLNENYELTQNFVPQMLGCHLSEALLDLFHFTSGPRIRDRISHGEVLYKNVPFTIIHHLFELCLLVVSVERWRFVNEFDNLFTIKCQCHRFGYKEFCLKHYSSKIPNVDIDVLKQGCLSESKFSLLSNLVSNITSYKSCFHPLSILKTSFVEIITFLNIWKTWDHPICKDNEWSAYSTKFLDIKLSYSCMVKSYLLPPIFTVMPLSELLEVVQSFSPITLFTSKSKLELIKILQKIVTSAEISVKNINESLVKKLQLFINKSFRSRQRENYERQLDIIPCIVDNINFTLNVLVMIYINIDHIPFVCEPQQNSLFKILKNVLKNFENLVTFTNGLVNKYQESLLILDDNTIRLINYFREY